MRQARPPKAQTELLAGVEREEGEEEAVQEVPSKKTEEGEKVREKNM